VLAALAASDHDREVAADAQAARWAGTGASRERLLQLNAAAQTFFASQYETSWAANYVSERLGTDPATAHLTGQDRFSVGYAPAGWTALTTHLRQTGASDAELVAAGLGTYASTGRVIDRFRDRIMFPITTLATDDPNANSAGRVDSEASSVEIHGFIARRNPAKTDEDGSGPKYLNTPETPLFTKGGELFGLADNYAALAAGATPVLVEGPLDAIAVTLAGGGTYVGIAPLGTAFTDTQADKFRPYIGPDRPAIIVAFDADRAGQTAAHRAFWQLAARGGDPAHLQMPDGTDPAALLHTEGATGLRDRLAAAGSLADEVLAAHIAPFTDRLDTIEGRIHALRQAADIVGALPVATWQHRSAHLAAQLGVAPQTAIDEVLAAGEAWTSDPPAHARRHLTERGPTPVKPQEHLDPDPLRRWAPLVDSLRVGLSSDPHWAVLAAHLARAAETGYDVNTRLPLLLALSPLPDGHAGLDLDFRLIADCPECLPPHDPDSATARADQAHAATEARIRMDISNHDAATRSRSVARQSPAPRRTGPSR
jgi:DNA primase